MAASVNANNAFSTLAGNITALDTSFTLAVGASFPKVAGGDWMIVTFQDAAMNIEIMKVTDHGDGTNSFTCVRGWENTVARAWITGDIVECRFTAGSTVTTDGVQTLTNKTFAAPNIRFADGTLAFPGIAWQNEPSTGFYRVGQNVMAAVINTQNVMQWQPSANMFNVPAYFTNGSSINFRNGANDAWWEVIHANAANAVHIGRVGWANTYIYGGGLSRINVSAGGVSFAGNVTGITKDMVGLGNVHNAGQIRELRQSGSLIYIGWNGQLEAQVDNTYFGGNWPINVTGSSASCTGKAGTAGTADNALKICDIGGWRYQNVDNNPAYLWGTGGNSQDNFLVHRASMSVNYASSAGSAGYANSAGDAGTVGGQSASNFLKSNDGSISNMKVWQDGNDTIWLEIATNKGFNAVGNNPVFSNAVRLFWYGPTTTMDALSSKVEALEAKLAALEAR